jgi:hypothetical protein
MPSFLNWVTNTQHVLNVLTVLLQQEDPIRTPHLYVCVSNLMDCPPPVYHSNQRYKKSVAKRVVVVQATRRVCYSTVSSLPSLMCSSGVTVGSVDVCGTHGPNKDMELEMTQILSRDGKGRSEGLDSASL